MGKRTWFYIRNIVLPLVFGLLIYLCFRKDTLVSLWIEAWTGIAIRPIILNPSWIEAFLRNYLSDCLWSYALAFSVSFILGNTTIASVRFIICAVFSIIMESLQGVGIVRGTFDVIDIFLELIAIAFALQLIYKHEEDKNHEKSG